LNDSKYYHNNNIIPTADVMGAGRNSIGRDVANGEVCKNGAFSLWGFWVEGLRQI